MKMMLVPFSQCTSQWDETRKTVYYGTPSRESWSFAPLECEIDEKATAEDLFRIFDRAIATAKANDDDDEMHRVSWMLPGSDGYRSRVDGFAIVKPEITAMLDGVRPDVCSDGAGDAIAHFELAFCVKHADRLVMV